MLWETHNNKVNNHTHTHSQIISSRELIST